MDPSNGQLGHFLNPQHRQSGFEYQEISCKTIFLIPVILPSENNFNISNRIVVQDNDLMKLLIVLTPFLLGDGN